MQRILKERKRIDEEEKTEMDKVIFPKRMASIITYIKKRKQRKTNIRKHSYHSNKNSKLLNNRLETHRS